MKKGILIVLYAIIIFPILVLFLNSIFIKFQYDDIFPSSISFENYKTIFSIKYLKLLGSSVICSLIASITSLVVSYLFARAISIKNCRFAKKLKVFSMIPLLVPAYAYIMGLATAFNIFKLNYTYIGVIVSHIIVILPYDIYAISNALDVVGVEYEEIAKTLGAKEINTILDISVPMIRRIVYISLAIGFVISFSQYFLTLVIGGGVVKTYAMHIFPLIQGNNRSLSAAFAFIFCLINIIVYYYLSNLYKDKKEVL